VKLVKPERQQQKNIECPYTHTHHKHTHCYIESMQNGQVSVFLTFSDFDVGYGVWLGSFWLLKTTAKIETTIIFVFLHALPNNVRAFFVRIFSSFQNSFSSNKHKEPFIWVRLQTNTKTLETEHNFRWLIKMQQLKTDSQLLFRRSSQVKISKLIEPTLRTLLPVY